MMRRMATATEQIQRAVPIDGDSQLALLKKYVDEPSSPKPILSTEIETTLDLLIKERQQSETLAKRGLDPTKSAVFVGAPGVGKTANCALDCCSAGCSLFILDLSAVMSSLLGRSGANLQQRSLISAKEYSVCSSA